MQTEPESSTLPQEKPTNNANVVSGEPLPLVPKHEAFPKPSLKDPLQHLWHLGLDDDRPPLSYTTPGESLGRLRQDLLQQYHRVCNSLGASDGLGSFPSVDEGGGKILWPVDPSFALDPLQPSFHFHAGGQHRLLAGPHALLGANSWLGYELEQPLSALQAIGHQPGSHIKEAVAEMIRNTHLGGSRAGRRGGSHFKALPNHAKLPQLALTQGEGADALMPLPHSQLAGDSLQGESSWVYPLRHDKALSSGAAAGASKMPSIDTLSDFVHDKYGKRRPQAAAHSGFLYTGGVKDDSGDQLDKLLREYAQSGNIRALGERNGVL